MSPEGTALPTCLITAQGCASGSFVSHTTGGVVQHQSDISDQTPSVRALQEPAATSGCTESLQHCLAMSQGTHKHWPQIIDLRTQGHINLGCTKTPVSRARLLQWTYSSQHLLFQDKAAINAPFKFWLWKALIWIQTDAAETITSGTKTRGCLAFSRVTLQLPPQNMWNPVSHLPEMVWQGWIGHGYLWKRPLHSKHPPKTLHTETCLSPGWGALTTVLMNADGSAASHPAKLPVKMRVLLSGLREALKEGVTLFMPRRSPVPPLLTCQEWDLWWDWIGSHNSNTAPASRFAEQ